MKYRFFSIDCEFSGLDHTKYDLISVGIVEIQNNLIRKDRSFYIEIKPQHRSFDGESMKINGLNFDNLYRFGTEPIKACQEIVKFLDLKTEEIAVFIGYCLVLDKIYLDQLFYLANQKSPFHYETIEISSLAIGKLCLPYGFTEEELEKKLNIQPMSKDKKHNALNDAIHQAEEYCKIMNFKN